MTTLQEYLDQTYPTKELKEKVITLYFTYLSPQKISVAKINEREGQITVYLDEEQQKEIEGGELNLNEYVNLMDVRIDGNYLKTPLTKLDISNCFSLVILICINNNLTSANFLKQLPNPKKIEILNVYNNNIQPTDIELFSRFVNVKILKIGTEKEAFQNGKHNKFYGPLKSYQKLTKLERVCIEATDVDRGLEFLPMSLAKSTAKRANEDKEEGGYLYIECSPHDTNNKCSRIKEQLKPFDYDLE
ncbi:25943_t:CDS:1, partial [Gigaspora margarita]